MWYKIFDWCAMPITLLVTFYIAFGGEYTWKIWIVMIPVIIINEISKSIARDRIVDIFTKSQRSIHDREQALNKIEFTPEDFAPKRTPERLEEYKYVILEDGVSEGYDFVTGRRSFFKPNDEFMHGVEEVFPKIHTGTRVVGGDYPDCVPQAVRKKMYELKHVKPETI